MLRSAQRLSGYLPRRWDRRVREAGKLILNYGGRRGFGLRGISFFLLGRGSKLLVAPFGAGELLVDSRDEFIGRTVFIRGDYERIYMSTALSYLKSSAGWSVAGKVFVDVGANIGTSTVDALLLFGFAEAVCFEPHTRNFRLLRMNLVLNGLDERATVFRMALSDKDRCGSLTVNLNNPGDNRLALTTAVPGATSVPTEEVECARFDSLVENGTIDLDSVGLLWVDTQGHEAAVLAGASTAIQAGIPVVVEYCPELLESTGSLKALDELVMAHYRLIVDLRLLSHGLSAEASLSSANIGELHSRYHGEELTDLLLIP